MTMIRINRSPQVFFTEVPSLEISRKGEMIAVAQDNNVVLYDFSSLQEGQFLEMPHGLLTGAKREGGSIALDMAWPVSSEGLTEPLEPIEPDAVSALPEGEKAELIFASPQKPEPSAEAQLVVGLMQGLLASDTKAVSDDFIMRAAGVYEFPEYAVGQNYRKGEIIQQDGIFFEVLSGHQSLENWPPKSTGSVYRAISVSTDPDAGTLENPIPYPKDV